MAASVPVAQRGPDAEGSLSGDDPLSVGSVIRRMREAAGLSCRQLSQAAGMSASYVNKVESGHTEPSLRSFAKLAHELHMTSQEILLVIRHEALR